MGMRAEEGEERRRVEGEKEEEDEELEEDHDEQAMEEWLGAEVQELSVPVWRAVPSLRAC